MTKRIEWKKFLAVMSLILMAGLAAALAPGLVLAGAETWNIETIDSDQVHSTSIALDSQASTHQLP